MLLECFPSVSNDYRYNNSGAGVEEWWRGEGGRGSLSSTGFHISVQFNIKV